MDFLGKRITIAPNRGNLFMVCFKYRLDGVVYQCPLTDMPLIQDLHRANFRLEEINQFEIEPLGNSERTFCDFTVDSESEIFRAPVSPSLHHKIMDILLESEVFFNDYSVSFIVSTNVEVCEIDIVDDYVESRILNEVFENYSILLNKVILCQEHMPQSSDSIARMRSSIIRAIIE